ncbi:MAG: protein-glutamate O-methyltransferase [Candidatus Hydrogenedentes bacterium]|nr:protein-glutamate O-methyltransferase [Candidatus Hydrogenedentota bacterium]
MDTATFNDFRKLIYGVSGISLNEQKRALVVGRLSKRMRALGINDFREYYNYVLKDKTGTEITKLIDAISTNVTHFFREADHFTFLKNKLLEWYDLGQKRFRIWSSACSTGEEPYTIAMVVLETLKGPDIDIKILATDISTRVLEHSKKGEYYSHKVEDIPKHLLLKYFTKKREGDDCVYVVNEKLKNIIKFARLNLKSTPYPMQGPFDAIFCRNVMIYFDESVRELLISEIYRLLRKGGYLFIGHSESITSSQNKLQILKPSIYYKP